MFKNLDKDDSELAIDLQHLLLQLMLICFAFLAAFINVLIVFLITSILPRVCCSSFTFA